MVAQLDFLGHLAAESARFSDAIAAAEPGAAVPSCPGWDSDDLLWHLAEVQWFWGTVVRDGVDGAEAERQKPARPGHRPELQRFFGQASAALNVALAAVPPQSHAWTWSDDQTAGFVRRRQAHEALIHRVDAELTAGLRTPLDPELSADGVDEALRIMYGNLPDWGTFTPQAGQTLRLQSDDTGDSWLVTLGRFTGTDPDDGASYDEPDIAAAPADDGTPTAAAISAAAADLDLWLWHRAPDGPVRQSGDQEVLTGFAAAIGPGIS